jgi:hypothetical protein
LDRRSITATKEKEHAKVSKKQKKKKGPTKCGDRQAPEENK